MLICRNCQTRFEIGFTRGARQKFCCSLKCSYEWKYKKYHKKNTICKFCKYVLPKHKAKFCNASCKKNFIVIERKKRHISRLESEISVLQSLQNKNGGT